LRRLSGQRWRNFGGLIQSALAPTALLDHPASNAAISLVTDASATHVGAVLQQRWHGKGWQQLGFFSKKMTLTQARYSAFDRELLAVHDGILHFRYLLEGHSFTVFTDHLLLVGALHRVSKPKSDHQQRQLSFIAEFTAEIRHIAGASNVVADALSWPASIPSCAHCQILTYSCGHCWSFALLFEQFFIHSDGGGPVHQVGGSFSPLRNYRRRLCSRLGSAVWSASTFHF
jgi:RNase H-like domain found in reverse transcriptase